MTTQESQPETRRDHTFLACDRGNHARCRARSLPFGKGEKGERGERTYILQCACACHSTR